MAVDKDTMLARHRKAGAKFREKNREAINARARAEYQANKEEERAYSRQWARSHPDKVRASVRSWCEANKKRVADYQRRRNSENPERKREYKRKNRERLLEQERARYAKNPEKFRAKALKYLKDNPERHALAERTRRALARSAEGSHTLEDVRSIRAKQKNKCAYCRAKLGRTAHVDHIIALTKGGSNWPSNLQWLCAPCNIAKRAKDPLVFSRERGLLL